MQQVLEMEHEAGKATEEEVLDGVAALGDPFIKMRNPTCLACFARAKEGFMRLLG